MRTSLAWLHLFVALVVLGFMHLDAVDPPPILTAHDTVVIHGTAPTSAAAGATAIGGGNVVTAGVLTVDAGTGTHPAGAPKGSHLRLQSADATGLSIGTTAYGTTTAALVQSTAIGGTRIAPTATPASTAFMQWAVYGHDGSAVTGTKGYYVMTNANAWSASNTDMYHYWAGCSDNSTALSNWMYLRNGGLGIGVASPLAKLHIDQAGKALMIGTPTGNQRWVHVDAGSTTGSTQIGISSGDGGNHHGVIYYHGPSGLYPNALIIAQRYDGDIGFQNNNGTNALWISSGGNIGIGTGAPTSRLTIQDTSYSTTFTGSTTNVGIGNTIANGQFAKLTFGNANGNYAGIGAQVTSSGSYLHLGTSNNYGMGITNSALVIDPSGNVVVGAGKELRTGGASYIKSRSTAVSLTLLPDDEAIRFTGAAGQTITLPAASDGRRLFIKNRGTAAVTITRGGSDTVDGGTSVSLAAGAGYTLVAFGTEWSTF
mgnify:FL=1